MRRCRASCFARRVDSRCYGSATREVHDPVGLPLVAVGQESLLPAGMFTVDDGHTKRALIGRPLSVSSPSNRPTIPSKPPTTGLRRYEPLRTDIVRNQYAFEFWRRGLAPLPVVAALAPRQPPSARPAANTAPPAQPQRRPSLQRDSARIRPFVAAHEQIGQAMKSWRNAGQCSRPK